MTGRQVEIVPGNHLVAVRNGAVAVVAHRGPSAPMPDSAAMTTWLALHELFGQAAAKGGKFGRALTASAAQWAGEHPDAEFGLLAPDADGYAVFLRGGVVAVIDRGDRRETLRGSQHPATSVSRVHPVSGLVALHAVDDDNAPLRLPSQRGIGSLADGVAQGSGAVIWPAPAELHGAPQAPPEPEAKPAQRVELKPPKTFDTFRPGDKPPPRRAPLPVRPPGRPRRAPSPGRVGPAPLKHAVLGIKCARGHFNDPRVAFCRLCGLRMNQTKVISHGERPPLGFLVLDDGMTFILNDDLVFGRQPEASPAVRQGATPIRLADRAGKLSRAHAEFRLIDWDVAVVDLGSTNGTYVQAPGQPGWQRLTPQQPYLLAAGCDVLIGDRRVTFDSPQAHI